MTDDTIKSHIEELVDEEHRLWELESRGQASAQDRQRVAEIKVELDRSWDLLRQRRAKREFRQDPGQAHERDADTVEGYLG